MKPLTRLAAVLAALLLMAAPAHAAKLSWAPWSTPGAVTINVPVTGLDIVVPNTEDVILVWPDVPVTPKPGAGCVRIEGGRHLKSIGGECRIPPQGSPYNSKTRRCMSILAGAPNRLVHIEGFKCDGDVLDGIEMYSEGATFTIENSRFEGITARDETLFTDGHPDGLYFGASSPPKAVRIDRVTVVTDYQAFFFGHPAGSTYSVDMRNSNAVGTPIPGTHYAQLIWRADVANMLKLTNVYLAPQTLGNGSVEPLAKAVNPSDVSPLAIRAFYVDPFTVGWPAAANITGVVKAGNPDFCPSTCAGVNYVSPGYNF